MSLNGVLFWIRMIFIGRKNDKFGKNIDDASA